MTGIFAAAPLPPQPSELYLNVSVWVQAAVLLTVAAFVAQYTWYSPWWRDPVGRTIVIKDLCLMAAVAAALVLRWAFLRAPGLLPPLRWVSLVMVAAIAPIMCWRMWVWRKIHRRR